ncbi:hypothetical protein cyc_08759 [Cyclospora cayetanensis]|uniref:Uncharacterized protein n=1 Tax=Cyclospora cayetanensis TaxID=88456 RepID=A0A1D3CSE8_9EIME|nr:hypothetical protein cyc_08759 [Cyclospora cayetanensis]
MTPSDETLASFSATVDTKARRAVQSVGILQQFGGEEAAAEGLKSVGVSSEELSQQVSAPGRASLSVCTYASSTSDRSSLSSSVPFSPRNNFNFSSARQQPHQLLPLLSLEDENLLEGSIAYEAARQTLKRAAAAACCEGVSSPAARQQRREARSPAFAAAAGSGGSSRNVLSVASFSTGE